MRVLRDNTTAHGNSRGYGRPAHDLKASLVGCGPQMNAVILPDPDVPAETVRAWSERQPRGARVLWAWGESGAPAVRVPHQDRWAAIRRFRQACDAWNQHPGAPWRVRIRRGNVEILPGKLLASYHVRWYSYVWILWSLESVHADLDSGLITEVQVLTDDDDLVEGVIEWLTLHELAVDVRKVEPPSQPSMNRTIRPARSASGVAWQLVRFARDVAFRRRRILIVDHRSTRPVVAEISRKAQVDYQPVITAINMLKRIQRSQRANFATPLALPEFAGTDPVCVAIRAILRKFQANLPHVAAEVRSVIQVVDLVCPRIVVAHYWEGPVLHGLRAWSRASGQPFAVVQHGLQIGTQRSAFSSQVDADIFYHWCERSPEESDSIHNCAVEFVLVGNPVFPGPVRTGKGTQQILIAPTALVALFDDAWSDFWAVTTGLPALPELGSIEWVVRLHNLTRQTRLIERMVLDADMSFSPAHSFMEAAEGSLAVLTTVSSVVTDSMMCKVPVIVWNNTDELNDFGSACIVVSDRVGLVGAIRSLLEHPDTRELQIERQVEYLRRFPTERPALAIARHLEQRNGVTP